MWIRSSISFISVCFLFFILASFAFAQELIIEPESGRQPIINFIKSAKYSINLVMYGFTDQEIADAIIQQKNIGKTVKIILEATPYKNEDENQKTIEKIMQNQVDWKGSVPPFRLIHQKTLLVDDQKVMIMTFNFTHATFKNERNFALIMDDPKAIREIKSVFVADWNEKPIMPEEPNLFFSPENSRAKMLDAIYGAKKSIKIYAQNINDYNLVGALAKVSNEGVDVQILTSSTMPNKEAHYLEKNHVKVIYTQKMIIHAKVLIIDEQKVIMGSINLTRSSLDDNRELSFMTEEKEIVKKITETFNQDVSLTMN